MLRSSDDLQRWSAKDLRDKHKRLTTSATKAGNEKPEAPAMLSQETDVATKAPPSSACVSPGGLLGWLKNTPTKPEKFYAVQVGRKCRIFSSWAECEQQTTGFPGAKYKSFKTEAEALEYMNAGDNSKPPPPAPQQAPPLPAAAAASSEQAVVRRKKPKSKNGGCDGVVATAARTSEGPPRSSPLCVSSCKVCRLSRPRREPLRPRRPSSCKPYKGSSRACSKQEGATRVRRRAKRRVARRVPGSWSRHRQRRRERRRTMAPVSPPSAIFRASPMPCRSLP